MKSHRMRRIIYRLKAAAGPLWPTPRPALRIVFTITNGRSGSARLTSLFNALDTTTSEHEPEPRFDTLMHDVQDNLPLARSFVRYVKLRAIARTRKPVYVETSHMFGKGYFDAMLELDIPFSLILLRRDIRKVALSMLRLDTIPGRTRFGIRFYLRPEEAQFVKLPDASRFSDYQLCYWHVCETAARQIAYGECARTAGITVVDVDTDALNDTGVFEDILRQLGIDTTAEECERIDRIRQIRVNEKLASAPAAAAFAPPDDIDAQEAAIDRFVPERFKAGRVLPHHHRRRITLPYRIGPASQSWIETVAHASI